MQVYARSCAAKGCRFWILKLLFRPALTLQTGVTAFDSLRLLMAGGSEPLRRGPRQTTATVENGGARDAAAAREAAQVFRVYVEGVTKESGRPDLIRPEVAALLGRIFDLAALNALPPAQASDLDWLIDWIGAANATIKLFTRYGSKPGPQFQRNMTEYDDQYAAAMNFMIRSQAREAISGQMFMAGLPPEQRTSVREKGLAGARSFAAEWILEAICSTMLSDGKPANARLVATAIRDTREVWAGYFLPKDRAHVIEVLAGYSKQVPDETARIDLAAFTAALQAVN